ncbi:hypothetical protein BE221DRAFT_191664 [Ostreococcus tauri]|uniref:Uncharacterized protein n=1 Tax=Ostreococcus tauri TaxID=70448 RepID=A0A1Y5ICA6_OSTTA|nr:hypothetical protein BE221DRAFT_191664 [Ostreococcus tauri]
MGLAHALREMFGRKRRERTLREVERAVEQESSQRGSRRGSFARARDASGRDGSGRDVSGRGGRFDYGSSSHGGHGRERMYDADASKTFGRQHGSEEALCVLAGSEAMSIPAGKVTVHVGERSESYVRGEDGAFYDESHTFSGSVPGSPVFTRASSLPKAVVMVHSEDVDVDSGKMGAAGQRNRGSCNSLLLLEAQALSAGEAQYIISGSSAKSG